MLRTGNRAQDAAAELAPSRARNNGILRCRWVHAWFCVSWKGDLTHAARWVAAHYSRGPVDRWLGWSPAGYCI